MQAISGQLPTLRPVENRLWKREGLAGWWLNLTAPPSPPDFAPIVVKERIRKAELTSFSILVVFLFIIALASNSLANAPTAEAVGTSAIGLVICAAINRRGWTRTAAYAIPLLLIASLTLGLLQAKETRPLFYATYDLFALPIMISALIADRRAPWILAALTLSITLLDYTFAPHGHISGVGATNFDELGYEQNIYGWWGGINRDVALILFAAFFGWLGAISVEKAIARADRSDEIAVLNEQAARKEAEQAQSLNDFVQEVIDAFAAQANGQTRLLPSRLPGDPFGPYVNFINDRLQRFEQLRRQQGVWSRGSVSQAANLLATRLQQVEQGWLPVTSLVPGAFQSGIEVIDDLAIHIYSLLRMQQAILTSHRGQSRQDALHR